ncbi:MAG: redox-sensing transcriptional repressor Rex [Anaerolineae bacterium]|nr:redox-sensing transcriptional repressor Rex [Anaerolineae bacterium]
MTKQDIPDIIIGRLPIYLRALQHMTQSGQAVTSSQELGERLGLSAAQIRKDLSQFGEFGKQGTGYNITFLVEQLQRILKLDRVWDMAIVGAGDVGRALAHYQGFRNRGFQATLIFDNDKNKIGTTIGELTVINTDQLVSAVHDAKIKIGMVAVPAGVAQWAADMLVEAGVKAILNYAPIQLNVPPGVHVENIDPATHLQKMSYYL